MLLKCPYTMCGKESSLESFTSHRAWPCCGRRLENPDRVSLVYDYLNKAPEPEPEVKEPVKKKAPAKKKSAKKEKSKK